MSFTNFLKETNISNLSKEQKLVLLIGKEMEDNNYKLKGDETKISNIFKEFPTKENKFSYDFLKNENEYNLSVKNKKDGKYEIVLSSENRSTSEEIKIDNYLKDNDNSLITSYMKERLTNIEKESPYSHKPESILRCQNNNFNNFRNDIDINNNFERNLISDSNIPNNYGFMEQRDMNFRPNIGAGMDLNVGLNDLHGNLPSFVPGDPFSGPRGNLMGPEAFRVGGRGGVGVRYDPITPFPNFDFVPQYDEMGRPMNRDGIRNNLGGVRMPPMGNNFMGGSGMGGGFNPFI